MNRNNFVQHTLYEVIRRKLNKEEKFNAIVSESSERIRRICRYYNSNPEDQKDMYQEVLVNIWKSIDSFRGDSALSTRNNFVQHTLYEVIRIPLLLRDKVPSQNLYLKNHKQWLFLQNQPGPFFSQNYNGIHPGKPLFRHRDISLQNIP